MRRALVVTATLLAFAALVQACSGLCLTVYDECRAPSDASYPPAPITDAARPVVDAGQDAGLAGCVREGCEDECAGLDDLRLEFVCLFPLCVACQRGDASSAVFCGRLYSCGRDAGPPRDAGRDAGVPDAGIADAGIADAGPADATVGDSGSGEDAGAGDASDASVDGGASDGAG